MEYTFTMGLPRAAKRFTPQEYYQLEYDAEYKSDYYEGEIFAMAGGSRRHSLIVMNISGELRQRLKGRPCAPHDPNLRIKVKATGLRAYPDISVFCGPPERDTEDARGQTFTNPTVLFEVLSKSTEAFDRGLKWGSYRRIESLQAYVLVSQADAHAEVFECHADGSWLNREVRGLDAALSLPALQVDLPMSEIYDRIDFSVQEDED